MAANTTTPYTLEAPQAQKGGRLVGIETWTDLSPELVLTVKARLHAQCIRARVPLADRPMAATWRKRLAHVTET